MTRKRAGGRPTAAQPTPAPERPRARIPAWVWVVAAATCAYYGSLRGPFVLDDRPHIVDNLHLRRLLSWNALRHTTRPLVDLSLAVNYAVSGLGVWSYHLVNLAIHVAAALALLALVRITLEHASPDQASREGATPLALGVAMLWVVHPLTTQAVTYVIQRGEALAGLFTLLTLFAVARAAGAAGMRRWWGIAVGCSALGMASKQVMAVTPFLALAYDRIFLAGSWRDLWRQRGRLHLLLLGTLLLLPLFLFWAPHEWAGSAGFGTTGVTPWRYAAAQPFAILRYLRLAFWPDSLCLDYGWPSPPGAGLLVLELAAPAAILVATIVALARGRRAGFLGVAFALPLALTSSFIPTADPVFEHRMYLPLASVITAVVLGGDALLRRLAGRAGWPAGATAAAGTALVLVACVALAWRTVVRNRDYASELSIWSSTVRERPAHARPRNGLALALIAEGRTDEGVEQLQRAIRLDSTFADARTNLGRILLQRGQVSEARRQLELAVRLDPSSVEARDNLGLALSQGGQLAGAREQLDRAVRLNPGAAEPYANLGDVLSNLGRNEEAASKFEQALAIRPNDAGLHLRLGAVYARLGRPDPARRHFEEALALDPTLAAAHLQLGVMLSQSQRYAEAKAELERAAQLDSADTVARAQLGITCVLGGQLDEGERHIRRALRMNPRSPLAAAGMGLVLSSRGRNSEAAQWFAQAVSLKPSDPALRVQLGAIEAQLGNFAEARRQFEAALAIDPHNPAARWGLQQLGDDAPK
jgi:Flp pilus assembly protein TadD